MKKRNLILLIIIVISISGGCGLEEKNIIANDSADEITNDVYDEFYKNLYIGEAFKSGFVYIEPFSIERGTYNKEIEFNDYFNVTKFYPLEKSDFFDVTLDTQFKTYVPNDEDESRYFLQPFSQPDQYGLRYKTNEVIDKPLFGIVAFNHELTNRDLSVNGEKRPYSEGELNDALNEVKMDSEIKESDRTLSYIDLDATIIGAQQICTFYIKDMKLEMMLSTYNTHGTEYAGTVYVVDIIKDGQVVKTYKKYNWDGPY